MSTFQALELNKNNRFPNKEASIKIDVKIMLGNATIYVPSDDTKSLQSISNAEPRISR